MSAARAFTYLGIWALLGAYYALFERLPPPVEPAAVERPFLQVAAAAVTEMEVEAEGRRVRCRRDGDAWRVVDPAGATSASDLMATLVSSLTEAPPVERLSQNGLKAADFGLDAPLAHIALRTADGTTVRIALGRRNPAQTAVYARREGTPGFVLLGLNIQYYVQLLTQAVPQMETSQSK